MITVTIKRKKNGSVYWVMSINNMPIAKSENDYASVAAAVQSAYSLKDHLSTNDLKIIEQEELWSTS